MEYYTEESIIKTYCKNCKNYHNSFFSSINYCETPGGSRTCNYMLNTINYDERCYYYNEKEKFIPKELELPLYKLKIYFVRKVLFKILFVFILIKNIFLIPIKEILYDKNIKY